MLAVLVAAIGMPNIQSFAASGSSSVQSSATSSTAKLVLWLHGDCYQWIKTPSSGTTSMSAPHAAQDVGHCFLRLLGWFSPKIGY
ncbi:hypothetical protein [Acidovorax sp. JHL-3]|uniref:hypothetical protein n=1 Tax=Acidovorax sp. JHL-3 TaxID=1276755 RepID=UPI0012DD9EE4|nr:hypothetical protein [Acidovorax sp. JHL-3]